MAKTEIPPFHRPGKTLVFAICITYQWATVSGWKWHEAILSGVRVELATHWLSHYLISRENTDGFFLTVLRKSCPLKTKKLKKGLLCSPTTSKDGRVNTSSPNRCVQSWFCCHFCHFHLYKFLSLVFLSLKGKMDQYRASSCCDFRKKWRFWRFGEARSEIAITSKISLKSKNQDHFYTKNF